MHEATAFTEPCKMNSKLTEHKTEHRHDLYH